MGSDESADEEFLEGIGWQKVFRDGVGDRKKVGLFLGRSYQGGGELAGEKAGVLDEVGGGVALAGVRDRAFGLAPFAWEAAICLSEGVRRLFMRGVSGTGLAFRLRIVEDEFWVGGVSV